MRPFLRLLLFAAAATAGNILSGCGSEADPAPDLPGTFSGVVTALDETGRSESAAGITVTLEGGPAVLTTTTDATGEFEFKNLPLGTYDATLTRTDLGTSRAMAIVLDDQRPTEKRKLEMGKPSTVSITSFTLTGPQPFPNTLPFTVGVSYDMALYSNGFNCVFYISDKASVSNTDYVLNSYGYSSNNFGVRNQFQSSFSFSSLKSSGFVSGSTVYTVAYGAATINTQYFNVPDNKGVSKGVITNLNPVRSSVLSFVMP
ncbi:carboxypeptidase regulatory-like domain-containing protein [Hymenobacter lapidiphilus]|uniref:carboxypeptidase-like regulatory domain-containing protein n=1 Tax=Hymenobacter sp. CCM 8763 TaxID=2303334 RepID=UPI000E34395F|nr:carboxypeptidase-like regulatory domain-containing protein [Hymenobacter sp. CCM 8763]RFP66110.1 carboxypeptidase regulatory-like domain-containing protein [Hymenobacter sp. CCM 8763]